MASAKDTWTKELFRSMRGTPWKPVTKEDSGIDAEVRIMIPGVEEAIRMGA